MRDIRAILQPQGYQLRQCERRGDSDFCVSQKFRTNKKIRNEYFNTNSGNSNVQTFRKNFPKIFAKIKLEYVTIILSLWNRKWRLIQSTDHKAWDAKMRQNKLKKGMLITVNTRFSRLFSSIQLIHKSKKVFQYNSNLIVSSNTVLGEIGIAKIYIYIFFFLI